MIVCDVANIISFQAVETHWYQEVSRYARTDSPIILVGNKADENANRQVSFQQGQELAARLGMDFVETSAKTSQGVDQAFDKIVTKMKTFVEAMLVGREPFHGRPGPSRAMEAEQRDDASTVRLGSLTNLSRSCC